MVRDRRPLHVVEEQPDAPSWEELGVGPKEVAGWEAIGFGPFEAAMAKGDGFTASIAVHYRHQLQRLARSWERNGLGSAEGLRWHRAGFAVGEAKSWQRQSVDVETARAWRSGYEAGDRRPPTRRRAT